MKLLLFLLHFIVVVGIVSCGSNQTANTAAIKNGCDSIAIAKAVIEKITSSGFKPDSTYTDILGFFKGTASYYALSNFDTGPINDVDEQAGVSRYNSQSQIKQCLNGKEGIYHELKILVDHFNKWIQNGWEKTDFMFALDANNNINIIMVPIDKTTDRRVVYDPNKPETKAVDLGDLHP